MSVAQTGSSEAEIAAAETGSELGIRCIAVVAEEHTAAVAAAVVVVAVAEDTAAVAEVAAGQESQSFEAAWACQCIGAA